VRQAPQAPAPRADDIWRATIRGYNAAMRFSLRTLFVVLTAFCCFLGHEVSWLKQRRQFLSTYGDFNRYPYQSVHTSEDVGRLGVIKKCPGAPGLLWLFGEKGVNVIVMGIPPQDMDSTGRLRQPEPAPVATARRLFPESSISAP
jgi:hypothetical protein